MLERLSLFLVMQTLMIILVAGDMTDDVIFNVHHCRFIPCAYYSVTNAIYT